MDGAAAELTPTPLTPTPPDGAPISESQTANIVTLSFKELLVNEALLSELEAGVLRSFQHDYGVDVQVVPIKEIIEGNEGTVTLVKDGEKVVGAGLITDHPQDAWGEGTQPSQEISHVFILPEFREKGLGTKLMEEQIKRCVEKGGNVWAIMMRGEEQLENYRSLIKREAEKHGKGMSDWVNDATTNSYAYAYRKCEEEGKEGKVEVIFQGRTPNGPMIRSSANITADDSFSPDKLKADGVLSDWTLRKDYGDGVSKSVGITETDFNALYQQLQDKNIPLQTLRGLKRCTPLVLSVTVS